MGRHAAEVSDLDAIAAQFDAVDSDSIHLFTDGDTGRNNTDGAYRFIPAPIRHRKTADGRKYNPKPDRAFVDRWEAANRITAVSDPTDAELDAAMDQRMKGHKSKVLPPTEAEVPARLGVPMVLTAMAGFAVGLMCQFLITIAQGGVA